MRCALFYNPLVFHFLKILVLNNYIDLMIWSLKTNPLPPILNTAHSWTADRQPFLYPQYSLNVLQSLDLAVPQRHYLPSSSRKWRPFLFLSLPTTYLQARKWYRFPPFSNHFLIFAPSKNASSFEALRIWQYYSLPLLCFLLHSLKTFVSVSHLPLHPNSWPQS